MSSINDTIFGLDGNDTLYGRSGNDTLYGGNGNDKLYGEEGDDVLVGGKGDDVLEGGYGNDTYIWSMGDGNDKISMGYYSYGSFIGGGMDTLLLQDIAMAEMEFMSQGNDLVCTFTGTGEHITISNWCYGDNYQVSEFQFKDGILKKEDLKIG